MPRRLPALPPNAPGHDPARPVDAPADDDDAFDPDLDLLEDDDNDAPLPDLTEPVDDDAPVDGAWLTDDEPLHTDELDPSEHLLDDEPVPDMEPDAPPPEDEGLLAEVVADLPVVPWTCTAIVSGVEVPAVLDLTRATSCWEAPAEAWTEGPCAVELPGVVLQVALQRTPADRSRVVLGRDALAGRVLVTATER